MNKPHLIRALVYFSVALIVTTLFIKVCPLYISRNQMLLSLSIAGRKWILQAIAALVFLKHLSVRFLHGIGRVSLLGSLLLIPYTLLAWLDINNDPQFFFGSLVVAVTAMVFRYYIEVTRLSLPIG